MLKLFFDFNGKKESIQLNENKLILQALIKEYKELSEQVPHGRSDEENSPKGSTTKQSDTPQG
ncbi:MAG: hypothetical protein HKN48_00030 [Flavobacteriaceae bacterium]|nr:hypothetical protein [Flavobacteriaceae bacterium]